MVQGNSGESIYKNHLLTFNDFIRVWGDDCFTQRLSCGTMFQLAGAGEGILTIEPMTMGPFFLTI